MTTDGPGEPPEREPPRRKFYPPPPRGAPAHPIPLNYRDRRDKQPRRSRYRPPGAGDRMDLPVGLLGYLVAFILYVSWQGVSFRHILEVAGGSVILAVALGVATRRWAITVGVVMGALLTLGGCGLLSTFCFGWNVR